MSLAAQIVGEALLDVTSLHLTLEPSALRATLERTWSGHGVQWPFAAQGTVLIEWWRVHGGQVRMGALDQPTLSRALGATVGGFAAMLSPFALLSAERSFAAGARSGSARAERMYRALSQALGHYHELAVLVPDLRLRGSQAAISYVAAMWNDSAFARSADLTLGFGLNKRPGIFQYGPEEANVLDAQRQELLRATFAPTDEHAEPPAWNSILLGRLGSTGALAHFERERPPLHDTRAFELVVPRTLGGVVPAGHHRGIASRWLDVPARLHPPFQRLVPTREQVL